MAHVAQVGADSRTRPPDEELMSADPWQSPIYNDAYQNTMFDKGAGPYRQQR